MSKVKVLKASYLYPIYLDGFYLKNNELKNKSYNNQYHQIMGDLFGWSDVWKRTLEETGEFEVMEVMLTNEIIQKKWAEEFEVKFDDKNWLIDILNYQIDFFQPEILFVHDNIFLTSEVIKNIKERFTTIKLVIGYDGIALNNLDRFEEFDIVLSCLESTASFYTEKSKNKIKGYFFPLGFDAKVVNKLEGLEKEIPFSFIGSLVRGEGYHNKRIKDITKLVNHSSLQIYSNGLGEKYEPFRYLQRNRLKKFQFEEFWQVYSIGRKTNDPVYGLEMYKLLAKSKMTFNSHLDNAKGKAANMRLFEATGSGTCLITDYMDNLTDFFTEDEVVTYKTIPECIDKVKNLLRDDKLRDKISIAGQKKTLESHSLKDRILDFSILLK